MLELGTRNTHSTFCVQFGSWGRRRLLWIPRRNAQLCRFNTYLQGFRATLNIQRKYVIKLITTTIIIITTTTTTITTTTTTTITEYVWLCTTHFTFCMIFELGTDNALLVVALLSTLVLVTKHAYLVVPFCPRWSWGEETHITCCTILELGTQTHYCVATFWIWGQKHITFVQVWRWRLNTDYVCTFVQVS